MNKKTIIITLVILLSIGTGLAYLLSRPEEKQSNSQPTSQSATESDAKRQDSAVASPASAGTYVNYEDDIIAKTPGTKLLFFHAPWCPQCRDLENDIKQRGVPEGVTIIKIDYDTNQDLRKKYGVTLQTTFVRVSDSGELEKKFVAYDDPVLSSVKSNLL